MTRHTPAERAQVQTLAAQGMTHKAIEAATGIPRRGKLSIPARACLFHIWLGAGGQNPEAMWPSVAALVEDLGLDGYTTEMVDELVDRGWLDVDDTGRVWVHDWDEWQLAATQAIKRAYEAARKADYRWRRQKDPIKPSPLSPTPLSPDITGTQHHKTGQVSPIVRDKSGTNGVHNDVLRTILEGNGGAFVPSAGACRVCGEHVTDAEPGVTVGPGWIAHGRHASMGAMA